MHKYIRILLYQKPVKILTKGGLVIKRDILLIGYFVYSYFLNVVLCKRIHARIKGKPEIETVVICIRAMTYDIEPQRSISYDSSIR